jgi:very-short-patch-repair endonuclease
MLKKNMTVPPDILHNARELRKSLTDAESLLWQLLRNRRFCGFKFRRQHPAGRFILDYYCHDALLAIELDGGGHADANQQEYDAERTKELYGAGIRELRFWNNDVLKNTESVLEKIYFALFTDRDMVEIVRHRLLQKDQAVEVHVDKF